MIRLQTLLLVLILGSFLGNDLVRAKKPPPGCKEEMCIQDRGKVLQCRFQIARGHKHCKSILLGKASRLCKRFRRCFSKRKARCKARCKKRPGCFSACVVRWKYRCIRRSRYRCRRKYYRCHRKVSKEYKACLEENYGTRLCCKRGRRTRCSKECKPLRPEWKKEHWK